MKEFFEITRPNFGVNGNVEPYAIGKDTPKEIADKIYEYFEWAGSNKRRFDLDEILLILGINLHTWNNWDKIGALHLVVRWTNATLEEFFTSQQIPSNNELEVVKGDESVVDDHPFRAISGDRYISP